MHRAGRCFGLFLFFLAGCLIACTPSRAIGPAGVVRRIFVVPPAHADPLAEAAHDAFVRSLRQMGFTVPATPLEGEVAAQLSFEAKGASQALTVTLSEPPGRPLKVLAGPPIRTSFWNAALAGDEAARLARPLGPAPWRLGPGD